MKKGFTLIELIVVIAIIAVLAAIVAPNAFKAIEKGKISATIGDYKSIKTGAMAYYSDTGVWPADGTTTAGFVTDDGVSGWDGPYLEKWPPRDNWGGTYTFKNETAAGATHDWDGDGTNDASRYISVTLIPQTVCQKIDTQLDGTQDGTAGSIQYGGSDPETLYMLVSKD